MSDKNVLKKYFAVLLYVSINDWFKRQERLAHKSGIDAY